MTECPACLRGHLDQFGQCEKCGVFMLRGSERVLSRKECRQLKQDQDRISAYTEIARTKEDRQ